MMDNIAIRDRVGITPHLAEVFVRATIGGISVHGYPTPLQLEVVRQVAVHVMGLTVDVDTLEPLDAVAAAELITDPALRRRLVSAR